MKSCAGWLATCCKSHSLIGSSHPNCFARNGHMFFSNKVQRTTTSHKEIHTDTAWWGEKSPPSNHGRVKHLRWWWLGSIFQSLPPQWCGSGWTKSCGICGYRTTSPTTSGAKSEWRSDGWLWFPRLKVRKFTTIVGWCACQVSPQSNGLGVGEKSSPNRTVGCFKRFLS